VVLLGNLSNFINVTYLILIQALKSGELIFKHELFERNFFFGKKHLLSINPINTLIYKVIHYTGVNKAHTV